MAGLGEGSGADPSEDGASILSGWFEEEAVAVDGAEEGGVEESCGAEGEVSGVGW